MNAWLVAFVATCAIELVVVRMVLPRARVSTVLGARLATHPAVWIAMAVLGGPLIVRLGAVELWAALVEGRDLREEPRASPACGARALRGGECGVLARAVVAVAGAHDHRAGAGLA